MELNRICKTPVSCQTLLLVNFFQIACLITHKGRSFGLKTTRTNTVATLMTLDIRMINAKKMVPDVFAKEC